MSNNYRTYSLPSSLQSETSERVTVAAVNDPMFTTIAREPAVLYATYDYLMKASACETQQEQQIKSLYFELKAEFHIKN